MNKTSLIFLLGCTLHLGCKRSDCEQLCSLPPITAEGKNTFGCKVNGELFFADAATENRSFGFISRDLNDTCDYDPIGRRFLYTFFSKNGGSLTLFAGDFFSSNDNRKFLNKNTQPWPATECAQDYARYVTVGKAYQTDSNFVGEVIFSRFDTLSRIVSGTFHFTSVHSPTGESVTVTDGRFDINLSTFNK